MYKLSLEEVKENLEIEIFGIVFKMPEINEKLIKELEEVKEIESIEAIKIIIDKYLGVGAYEKLNEEVKAKLNKEIDILVAIKIISFINQTIAKVINKEKYLQNEEIKKEFKYEYKPGHRKYQKPYQNRRW